MLLIGAGLFLLGVVTTVVVGLLVLPAFSNPVTPTAQSSAPEATINGNGDFYGPEAKATLQARRNQREVSTIPPTPAIAAGRSATTAPIASVTPSQAETQKQIIQRQLEEGWAGYKQRFIQSDGRVIDPMFSGGLTTSEGQSYALLRSVWLNDREVFDRVWRWTQSNLQVRAGDKLLAYKWGKSEQGEWKVLDDATAADAETDTALALIFANKRWKDSNYQKQALEIMNGMWQRQVVTILGKPYLTAGEWAPPQSQPTLNPSYLAPYALRIFAQLDSTHNWAGLVDTSYEIIRGCSEMEVGGQYGVKLPPNWCSIDKLSGKYGPVLNNPNLDTNYGYDAFRTYWRVALDYKWFGEKRALEYLTWSDTLRVIWNKEGRFSSIYDYRGNIVQESEDLAIYSGSLGNFIVAEPGQATALLNSKLNPTYHNEGQGFGWGNLQNYYNQNWVWFGLALYNDSLPNLALGSSTVGQAQPGQSASTTPSR